MKEQRNKALNEILEIVESLYQLFKDHKKVAAGVLLFEFWVHSLAVHHLSELKQFMDLVPFLGH